MVIFLAW